MSKLCINYKAELNDYLKIINEPNRLKILCLLKGGEMCVCDIVEALAVPQNLVSHHLKVLKDFGLLDSKKDKQKVIYHRREDFLKQYQKLLNKIIAL